MTGATTLILLAKSPVAGRVKTRLCPPCTPAEAATIAEAALRDTLDAMQQVPAVELVVALEGRPGAWLPPDVPWVRQRGAGLDERLAAAFEDVGGSALLIGMDTPQVRPELLAHASALLADGADAVLGPADDGGYWAVGLRQAEDDDFVGVPMSTGGTGAAQRQRLVARNREVHALPPLRDVDHWDDAVAVAAATPGSRFAAAVRSVDDLLPVVG